MKSVIITTVVIVGAALQAKGGVYVHGTANKEKVIEAIQHGDQCEQGIVRQMIKDAGPKVSKDEAVRYALFTNACVDVLREVLGGQQASMEFMARSAPKYIKHVEVDVLPDLGPNLRLKIVSPDQINNKTLYALGYLMGALEEQCKKKVPGGCELLSKTKSKIVRLADAIETQLKLNRMPAGLDN